MRKVLKKIQLFIEKVMQDHVGAYAAQSAYFLVLSLIPIILLLMTLVQYTPITKADVLQAVYELFPRTVRGTMVSIVNQVYAQSKAMIPVTILMAMWSAGRGVLAITAGLNTIHGKIETRNYIVLRIRAAFYTILLVVAVILSLVVLGFGNSISFLVNEYIPVFQYVTDFIIEIRTIAAMLIVIPLAVSIYRFLPDHKTKMRYQLPGAIFTAVGWAFASFLISMYMDIFKGFSSMYGSLTTIILIMLWLYFCMYVMLLGGEINLFMEEHLDIKN